MPRSQKQLYPVRYQLEKLRLDVALKRSRLAVIKKAIPRPYTPPKLSPEQTALAAEQKAIAQESALIFSRHRLSEARIQLDRKRRELDKSLEEEEYLKSHYA